MNVTGPPPNPLVGRQRRLVAALRAAVGVAFATAVVGLLGPGRVGRVGALAFLATLVATPIARVVWLLVRWIRRGDRRFASAAAALLLVVGAAAVSAL